MLDLNRILRDAESVGAHAVHIRAGKPPFLRFEKRLTNMQHPAVRKSDMDDFLKLVLTKEQSAQFKRSGDLTFFYRSAEDTYRVSMFHMAEDRGFVVQKLESEHEIATRLGLPDYFEEYLATRNGLLLFSGPMGSIKAETMISMLRQAGRKRQLHVMSVEQPIQYHLNEDTCLAQQMEVGQNVDSFVQGVEISQRLGPDAIVVSEIPDSATMRALLKIADAGTVVLAAVDASTVTRTIEKLDSLFPEREKAWLRSTLADQLKAVIHAVPDCRARSGSNRQVLENSCELRSILLAGDYYMLEAMTQTVDGPRDNPLDLAVNNDDQGLLW